MTNVLTISLEYRETQGFMWIYVSGIFKLGKKNESSIVVDGIKLYIKLCRNALQKTKQSLIFFYSKSFLRLKREMNYFVIIIF